MKKQEIISMLTLCKSHKKLLKFTFDFSDYNTYYYPFIIGENYFVGIEEDDFMLDGYEIRPYNVIKNIEYRDGLYSYINEKEGLFDSIIFPEVNLNSWSTIFESLKKMNKIIIVENEFSEDFAIGFIEKIFNDHISFIDFDADGIWSDKSLELPYSLITNVIFNSRYINVWEKYLSSLPKNKLGEER
jgi:hypothetical protein